MRVRLTPDDRERISRFRAGFNVVEQAIRKRFGNRRDHLSRLIERLNDMHPEWKYRDQLLALASLRNEIAHAEGTDQLRAIPTESAIDELKRILKSVTWLDSIGQRFSKKVEHVSSDDNLGKVLELIRVRDYSQFPVIDAGRLKGLLTENGITRWLAANARSNDVRNRLQEVCVEDLLDADTNSGAYEVVSVSMTVERAVERMSAQPTLEALLVRDGARSVVPLRGIVTRWDILQVVGEQR